MKVRYTDPNGDPCELAPLEAFSDEIAEDGLAGRGRSDFEEGALGRRSQTVRLVFASRCCGYLDPPSANELYDAMRREEPTERDWDAMGAWIAEATTRDYWRAWTEQAYSWRMLARALKGSGAPFWRHYRWLNRFAARPELIPPHSVMEW